MSGRWIALEGGEGSGKSTQAALLASAIGAVLTREPGGTELGQGVRALLLDPAYTIDPRAEALLMAADRAEHVARVVAPALAGDRDVVSDRSAWSSLAYQGYGRGLDVEWLRAVSDWAMGGRWPDLAILIDVSPATAAARLAQRGGGADRLESAGSDFHDRVRSGFGELARSEPDRWLTIDGEGSLETVAARVAAAVAERLPG